MTELVLYEVKDHVALVTINRPKSLNALSEAVLAQLDDIVEQIEADKAVRSVIITGAGDKAFVAGADIDYMKSLAPHEAKVFSALGHRVFTRIENLDRMVIAAVNGYALGGGCELAMACDIRIGSDNARIGIPEASLGLIPGFGGTQRLPRIIGMGKAKELLGTGRQMNAKEAMEAGWFNHILDKTELMNYCMDLAQKIAGNSSSSIAYGKQCMNLGIEMDQDKAMELEAVIFGLIFSSADAKEGMAAFLERRKPIWS